MIVVRRENRFIKTLLANTLIVLGSLLFFTIVFSAAAFAAPNTGMVVYGDTANAGTPKYRAWSGTDFGAEASAYNNVNSAIRYIVNKEAPTRSEYMVGAIHADGKFYIQMYGTAWSSEGIFSNTAIGDSANGDVRYFDIAYEQSTGDAVVVYERSTSNDKILYYRVWNGTSWSSESQINYNIGSSSNGVVYWVKLEPKKGSDQILLTFMDSNLDIYAYIWDGSAWGNSKLITTDASNNTPDREVFSSAWEGTSGDAMVVYADNTNTDAYYHTFSGGSWSGSATQVFNNPTNKRGWWVKIAGDPTSDYIGLIMVDVNPSTHVRMWAGSAWETTSIPTYLNNAGTPTGRPIDVAWQASGGKALFALYRQGAQTVDYITYTRGSGWSNNDLNSLSTTSTTWANKPINTIQLVPDPVSSSTQIMLTAVSVNNDIKSIYWTGAGWTQPTTYNYENSASNSDYEPFMFAWVVVSADTTPPANVTGFTVTNPGTGNTLNLSWINPTDADFAGVKIVSANGGTAPADCSGAAIYQGTGTSYSGWGIFDNTLYSYRICSYDTSNNFSSGVTGSGTPTDTVPPGSVTSFTAVGGDGQVFLSWTNPTDADFAGTKILRKTGGYPVSCTDATATQVYDSAGTSHTDTTAITNGTTYYYLACAHDEAPNYAAGATATATPQADNTPPANVIGFTVTNLGTGNKLGLSWTNPSDIDFSGVKVVRSTGGTAPGNCSGSAVYSGTAEDYTDSSLTDNTLYSYRICSYDLSGNYSSGVTGSGTPTDTTAPGSVTNFAAVAGNNQVTLSWTNPTDADFAGTKILRKTGGYPVSCTDATATQVYDSTGTSHVDNSGVTNGTTYYYLACAHDEAPNYAAGATASATPGNDVSAPDAISNLAAQTVFTRGVALTWTASGDDGNSGTASIYDIRFMDAWDYPQNIISSYLYTNWAAMTQAVDEPAPQPAGASESFTVVKDTNQTNLKPNTLYYFGIKAIDDFNNVSGISNVISAHTALKYGYNTISLPHNTSTGGANTINNIFIDDVPYVYMFRWQPGGLDAGTQFKGSWAQVSSSGLLTSLSNGTGYYLYAYAMNTSIIDEKNSSNTALLTENANNWVSVTLSQGRNLVGNPYLKNVDFANIKICKNSTFSSATGCGGGTINSFADAVVAGWMDGNIAYYANSTTYTYETCSGISCLSKLRPWWGQWVYLLLTTDTYIMAIPKP